MSREKFKNALLGRGYEVDHKHSTSKHVCYRKPSGFPARRAIVFVKRDGSGVLCGPTLLTAEPCPEFEKALLGDYRA
jgi:hypothetical protein